jgi:hypothetical protein
MALLTKKQEKQIPELVQAALSGETKNVLAMLKKGGLPIEVADSQGNHALGAASCGGHLELVKALVEKGAQLG